MATELLLNSTEQEQWSSTGSPNHDEINEGDPENLADYLEAADGWDNKIDIYGCPNTITDVDEVTQIVVKVFYTALEADQSPSYNDAYVDIDLGGYQGSKDLENPWVSGVSGWKVLTWAGLSGSQADLDGLEIKLGVGNLAAGKIIGDIYTIYSMYIEVTYTATTGYSHKFCGVLSSNIGKISGVATASIGKVKGVD